MSVLFVTCTVQDVKCNNVEGATLIGLDPSIQSCSIDGDSVVWERGGEKGRTVLLKDIGKCYCSSPFDLPLSIVGRCATVMPPRTRGDAKRQDTPQRDKDKLGGKMIENGGKVSKPRRTQNKRGKAYVNSGGNREIDISMLDAEHIEIGSNISTLTEQNEQAAAGSCTKICETIYVGGRRDRSPSSPTGEAETIHVAGYEVDANPLLEENGIADPELDPAMLDAQDGESGSDGITSPAERYEQVANTMEGVEHGEGEANPLSCRAGSNNHTEGNTPVQNTIAGTAEVVAQIEANASTGTGSETGNISLPVSCDEEDQQEIGVHLESDIHKGNRDCSKQRDQTFAAKGTNQERYMNQRSLGKDGVEDHTPPEMNGTHFARTSNVTMNLSGSMAVNLSNMNRIADITFGSLTTVEGVTNPLIAADKMGKRLRETSTDVSSPELRARDESPTRKRRRVMEDLKKKQQSEEVSVPTNWGDERNIAELDGMGVLCGVDTGTGKVETDKLKSDMNVPDVRSDGEVLIVFSKGKANNGQSNTELHATDTMGAVESASLEADIDRRGSDSDMRELGSNPDADMACPAETADNRPSEPELDGMENLAEMSPRSYEVETSMPIYDTNMQEVRRDSEVGRAFPEGKKNNEQSNKELQEMESLGSVDYRSSATGTKQNCDTNMPDVGIEEIGCDIEAHRASYGEKTNDEQTNLELGIMESSGSVEAASLNADTERQNRDSDMHEEQRNADFNDEKLVSDVDSALQSPAQKKDPIDVHIDAAQSPQSAQMGCPSEPGSPLKEKDSFMEYTGISPDDNLRRVELERSCVKKLDMKNAHLLIDMIDSLSSGKADMYYLLAFKMVLLIFPNKSWDHVRDRLPAMMGYATENIKTGLEERVMDEVYTEYPSDKGVDERIICWNQRLELYKGIEYGSRKLLDPKCPSVSTRVGNGPMGFLPLQAEIQERTREPDHCQMFQDYFSDYASRAAFVFQSSQLRFDENRKEEENHRLRQQIEKIEEEKKKLQNEKHEWGIEAERIESLCKSLGTNLLPVDPERRIQVRTVEDGTQGDKDVEMNDSPSFVGTSISSSLDQFEALEAQENTREDIHMDSFHDLRKQRQENDKRETIEKSGPEARSLGSHDLDSEKTLERMNMSLKKENMGLRDTVNELRKLQKAFGEKLPPSSQSPYVIILETLKTKINNIKAESSNKEIRIQELEQEFKKISQTLHQEQADKSDIQVQLDVKTQTLSFLEDKLQQTEKEKACIQNKSDQWKAQIDEIENRCKSFKAKLLPVDLTRDIGYLRVKSSPLNDGRNHQDGSDGLARNSIPKLKEELTAVKLSVKNKEESRSALEEEKTDLLKTIANLEENIKAERDKNKTAYGKIKELEAQLHIQGMNQQEAVRMQTQIMQLEQEIKSIQQKEQDYKVIIEQYDINDWIETRTEQITKVEQFLKDAETGVQEQKQAFVKVRQELEAAQADASNKEETYRSAEQETIRLKETLEEMEQTMSRNNKEVGDLTVQLQEAQREIGDLTTTLATVESTLDRERISSASEIEGLLMKVERLEKTKQEYEVSIDESENLNRRLREMEEERTKAMNVQDAIERKDETISRLGKDIENIKEGHISEINRLTEDVCKVNNQAAQEKKANSTVTNVNDRSYAIPERLEVALQKLERWKESGDKFVESQKRIDHVFSTMESLPSRLEQVLTTHQPSASADSVAQAAHDGILTRLETNVKDLKHAIDRQHISSQENVESNEMRHSVEEINNLTARVNQQREELSKELSRLTEQTSQLSSGIKDKDKQYNEAVNTLLTYKSKCESDFERLNERVPVLEIKQLTKQIHELQEQIRALGPELKHKNQDLGTLREDICSTKAQTMTCQEDMKQMDIIVERLSSDIQNINSKLIDIEKGMVRQQIAYDEWRKASHYTPTRNTQRDESSNFSKLESQLSDLNHVISQLRDKDRLVNEVQKLQNSTTERDSKLNGLKDTMDWLVEEVRKLQKRIKDSEAESQERQCDMARFLRLSTNAWISQKPTSEAASKLNGNDDRRGELDGLREELGQVEKNIMYFTSTFPPPSGQPFSTVMEERFLSKVPVTERLKVLIERVRYRIDDLQSSLEQAKLNYESAMRPERTRSTIVSQANEVVTPVSELNMEFLTPTGQESGIIQSPTVQRQPRPIHGKHNADPTHGGGLPEGSLTSGPRSSVKAAFTQTVTKEVSKISTAESHEAFHASTDKPMGSRKLEEEHALGSDSVRADLERLRASLIFHLCTMLFSSDRTVNVEGLREGSRIFSRRTIGKGNLELLEKVIEGYSRQSMKSRGANKELRKITYKGRKAFPDPLLKTYTTIFKTLLTLTQHLDINEPSTDAESTKGKAAQREKGTTLQEGTRKPKRKRSNLAQVVKTVK
ncbi:hypothetical protein FOC1_g10001160 [Fusarium oxysporum f. sp. cubense race 1]|uniref:Uncharacterized protein n=1 Tax=Fusarium oxysporum f. sp. cubense (strain race 1) TaxID=1229664 RepID=N4TTA9_FUSC1|nr:hypothetical protein FOC1_g10001160 [Fusarium oxysporum f. sp. cubense race 1]